MLKAITRQASLVDEKIKQRPPPAISTAYFFDHIATDEDTKVAVTEEDFMEAKRELIGSVSQKELEHYDRVREMFEVVDKKPGEEVDVDEGIGMNKGKGKAKGKGKGRMVITYKEEDEHSGVNGFGDAGDADEDLYSDS